MKSFFFNDTATTEIYTLALHDALPIFDGRNRPSSVRREVAAEVSCDSPGPSAASTTLIPVRDPGRSEEHTSELQSRQYLVCRLLLEKRQTGKPGAVHRVDGVPEPPPQH